MTRPDLAALEALLAKATPGPYYWFMCECADKDTLMVELTAVVEKTVAVNGYNLHGVGVGEPEPDADYLAVAHTGCGPRSPINAQLIAAAVNALPALIARVRELERERGAAALVMRERCIKACDTERHGCTSQWGKHPAWADAINHCVAAIRALEV